MRIFSASIALVALALAACDSEGETKGDAGAIERGQEARAAAEGRIPCAIGGGGEFTLVCTIDRQQTQDGLILLIRHPDGGFHKLKVATDGRGVIAADGAAQAVVSVVDKDVIEVALEGARYRLPATIRPGVTQ